MKLSDRIYVLSCIFEDLQDTSSINDKRFIVSQVPEVLKEDFNFVIECLNGVHKFGYKYYPCNMNGDCRSENNTVKEVLEFLLEPARLCNLTESNIARYVAQTFPWHEFFEPIVNRELKLGIGKSILPKDGLSAMLAKKYEGKVRPSKGGYYITEKLDGNRCIARFDGERWRFTSRNGKEMYVNFDMSGLPKEFVYDGEILVPGQVNMSADIYEYVVNDKASSMYISEFNSTSGLINRHSLDKKLVYNIFDIMLDDVSYSTRRSALNTISKDLKSTSVRVLPVLAHYDSMAELNSNAGNILDKVVSIGGEGIMINLGDGLYTHKRTDQLLKYKEVQTIDMHVVDVQFGTGKYEGMIGAIDCVCTTQDGKIVSCKVGSGLSDKQRLDWAISPAIIIGKIVEVAYFSMSQDNNAFGTNMYSLRFPRLKCVRFDKEVESEY